MLTFDLDESKLAPPPIRSGIVDRAAIVERLLGRDRGSVIAVVAPPGYGKTTVLAQWAAAHAPRASWLSVDDRDNDPTVLLTYLAAALDRVEPIGATAFGSLATPGAGVADVARLGSVIASMDGPVAIVIDHAEALVSQECQDMVAELAVRLPPGSRLAIGSRRELPLPVPRLRASGRLAEIGATELAMTSGEASALLHAAGVELAEAEVDALVERTEGWAAGLYLAALAINAGGSPGDIATTFTGDDRFMADYLRSEFLDHVSRADVAFLTRTSILERMSGPLCDVTVGTKGSGASSTGSSAATSC